MPETSDRALVDISIVIVNYNVKEYLANLIYSINEARGDFNLEIFVVDNHSTDGSIPFLKERFPDVIYIENTSNEGFGKANNQAIRKCRGKYTLLVNPDVLISENTLSSLYAYLESDFETAACGCKILNPDGSFAPESRRAIPTPMSAMYKVLGLSSFFPDSKRFASYYMGGESENERMDVEVLSGSFMFFRTSVLQELGGFDERFFMYGEDIDLCYRTLKEGYKIKYIPDTSIIHYKGESTKKDNLRYIITFNKALYQFFEKHYSYGYSVLFRFFILTGIVLKSAVSYVVALFNKTLRPAADVFTLNVVLIGLFLYRYNIHPVDIFSEYRPDFLIVNLLCTFSFLIFAKYYALYGRNVHSISNLVKTVLLSFITVVVITFFVRDFAFSRLILLGGSVTLLFVLPAYRIISARYFHAGGSSKDKLQPTRVMIAGINPQTGSAISKIRAEVEWNYEVVGLVSQHQELQFQKIEKVDVVGHLSQLPELVKAFKADQVLFILDSITHIEVLKSLSQLRDTPVICKVVPNSLDYIIGKSNVDYFDDVPVVDLELPSLNAWNRFLKRNLDFWISLVLLIVLSPVVMIKKLMLSGEAAEKMNINIYLDSSASVNARFYHPHPDNKLLNTWLFLKNVFKGEFSLVGAPIILERQGRFIYYKPGLTGLRQINEAKLFREEEKERYEMHYLQTYTIWKDLEILFRSLQTPPRHFTSYFKESGEK